MASSSSEGHCVARRGKLVARAWFGGVRLITDRPKAIPMQAMCNRTRRTRLHEEGIARTGEARASTSGLVFVNI